MGTILVIFIYKSLRSCITSFELIGLLVQEERRKTYFQDGRHGGHLRLPIGAILAIYDLQITPMLPTKFQVNQPFGSEEETKNRFSRWMPRRQVTPMLPTKF